MKRRMNVVLDDELVEKARKVMGEKTFSAAITKALEKVVRQDDFWAAYDEWKQIAWTEGVFDPEYIKEKMANSLSQEPARVSAHEKRGPRRGSKRRASR